MPASTSSRPNTGRGGHPAAAAAAATVADHLVSDDAVRTTSTTSSCKEPLLSSSDTDDCDGPALVIDLDASAGINGDSSPPPPPQSSSGAAEGRTATHVSSGVASGGRNADGMKSRGGGSDLQAGSTGRSSGSHRIPSTKAAADVSDAASTAMPQKGLKMKIKCQAGSAGGPARHEVSHFHPVVVQNNAQSSAAAVDGASSTRSSSNSSSSSSSSSAAVADSKPDRESSSSSSGSGHSRPGTGVHRKEHRTAAKDRSAKERSTTVSASTSDHQTVNSASSVVAAASTCNSSNSSSSGTVSGSSGTVGAGSSTCVASIDDVKPIVDGLDRDQMTSSHHDPYEFNVKTEDSVGRPTKKIKLEKCEVACSPMPPPSIYDPPPPVAVCPAPTPELHDAAVDACHVGVLTDPDCLGPCEPGTTVTLEGIVWNETENGLLVVNVTWRGKTYVGTLMDATRHHWAPPRFASESPTSDLDGRTPKGRGKRGRTCTASVRSEFNGSDRKLRSNRCTSNGKASQSSGGPGSPLRSEGSLPLKRPRVSEGGTGGGSSNSESSRANSKSSRSDSRTSNADGDCGAEMLLECPAPKCSKKYRQLSGLRYHQSHAHPNIVFTNDEDETDDIERCAKQAEIDTRHSAAVKLTAKMEVDDAESTSDGWRVVSDVRTESSESKTNGASVPPRLVGNCEDTSSSHGKADKKNKPEHRTKSKQPLTDSSETSDNPHSPSGTKSATSKSSSSDSSSANNRDKSKHKKKDRDKAKSNSTGDRLKEADPVTDGEGANGQIASSRELDPITWTVDGRTSETHNKHYGQEPVNTDMAHGAEEDMVGVLHEDGLSAGRMSASDSGITVPSSVTSNVPMHSMCEQSRSPAVEAPPVVKCDLPNFVPSPAVVEHSNSGVLLTPIKKSKSTPSKHHVDLDNPHSPAYSDISDANDSAPMLEKEATPSRPVDEDEMVTGASTMGDHRPLSRHLPDAYGGSFSGQSSSALYGQPPCLTPAVVPPALDGTPKHVKSDKPDVTRAPPEDRHAGAVIGPVQRPPRQPSELGARSNTECPPEHGERNLSVAPRSVPRTVASDTRSSQSPVAPLMPQNMFNVMYPSYIGGALPGFDAAMLMQHPDLRAHYERLIQQEVRRHDLPAPASRPSDLMLADGKGFPSLRPGDCDRRGSNTKGEVGHAVGSLPTPPSLIPDRGMPVYDEQDSRGLKLKGAERRDEPQRNYLQQPYPPVDRQRRHEEPPVLPPGKDGSAKPSAVVAPQARDRNAPCMTSSSKLRPEEQAPRSSSLHDQNRNKSQPKGTQSSSSHPDMQPRTPKEQGDRASRDEKGTPTGNRPSFKPKEDIGGGQQVPVGGPPLSLPVSYAPAPYYPYLPGGPQYAGAPLPFDPAAIYSSMNPIIGYPGAPPSTFLHPAQMGYLPSATPGDVGNMMPPPGTPLVSPSDGKPRDVSSQRGFYPGEGPVVGSSTAHHKIHELKEVAKGTMGPVGTQPEVGTGPLGTPGVTGSRDAVARPDSRGGISGAAVGKDHDRNSPPMQRHLHTHHHMHMLGPLFSGVGVFPGDPAMMASSQAAPPPMQRPYLGK